MHKNQKKQPKLTRKQRKALNKDPYILYQDNDRVIFTNIQPPKKQ